jgi:hypothetical protein
MSEGFQVLTSRDGRLQGYADAIDGKPLAYPDVHVPGAAAPYWDAYLDGYADGEGVQAAPGFTVVTGADDECTDLKCPVWH